MSKRVHVIRHLAQSSGIDLSITHSFVSLDFGNSTPTAEKTTWSEEQARGETLEELSGKMDAGLMQWLPHFWIDLVERNRWMGVFVPHGSFRDESVLPDLETRTRLTARLEQIRSELPAVRYAQYPIEWALWPADIASAATETVGIFLEEGNASIEAWNAMLATGVTWLSVTKTMADVFMSTETSSTIEPIILRSLGDCGLAYQVEEIVS